MYRVWTKNINNEYSLMTDWITKTKCQKFIISRWKHWPSFAFISKAQNLDNFIRHNGK